MYMNKYLLTLAAGLTFCAGQAFAQDAVEKTFACTGDTWIRQNNENYSGSSATNLEFRKEAIKDGDGNVTGYATWVALLGFDYNVPAGMKVSKATLKVVTERNKGGEVSVRGFSGTVSDNSTWATEGATVEADLKNAPISTFGLAGQYNKALFDNGIAEDKQSLAAWTNNIDVTAYLQSLGAAATHADFMFSQDGESQVNDNRIYSKDNSGCETKWGVTFGSKQLVPQLIVTYVDEATATYIIKNERTGLEYADLASAWKTAESDDVLLLNQDVTLAERLNTDSRNITVKGNGKVTITRAAGYNGMLFLTSKSGDVMTLSDLTIDDANIAVSGQTIEVGNSGTAYFNNVNVVNSSTTSSLGVIAMKSGGKLNATNLNVSNYVVPQGMGAIFVGSAGSSVSGDCTFSLFAENNNNVNADGLVGGKITLCVGDGTFKHNPDVAVVTGAKDVALFATENNSYFLQFENGSITFTDTPTGIDDIMIGENQFVNVYNIQGILIRANVAVGEATVDLPAGLYIVGGKKVYVR